MAGARVMDVEEADLATVMVTMAERAEARRAEVAEARVMDVDADVDAGVDVEETVVATVLVTMAESTEARRAVLAAVASVAALGLSGAWGA